MSRDFQIPFELRHLVYFREVARRLHFRQAAEALAIAQPALSRAIAQLEAALDVDLLSRTRRGVELTPAGRLLLDRTESVLRTAAALPAEIRAVAVGDVGNIRVAFTGLAMSTVLPRILRDFHQQHPGIRLELTESPTAAQLAALAAGEIACGFFHPDAPTPALRTRLLLKERNGILLPASHALAHRQTVSLRDLADTAFVLFPRTHNTGFYDRILGAFAAAEVAPRIAEEIWPRANGIGLVRAGIGATFITPSEAQNVPNDVVFRPLTGPAPESRVVLGWSAVKLPDPALARFLAVAEKA